MSNQPHPTPEAASAEGSHDDHQEFVTVMIEDQWFGIPVNSVRDVLGAQQIARIPLAPDEVAGSLNLRGRIVTAIDPRVRLGLPKGERSGMGLVFEHDGESYSLLIDSVGEVLNLPDDRYERNPATLNSLWREISAGIYRLDDRLLVVMDIARLLDFDTAEAA